MTLQNGTEIKTWHVERADDLVEIRVDDNPAQLWTIYWERDAIPESLLPDGEQQEQVYEVKLAIARDGSYEYRPFVQLLPNTGSLSVSGARSRHA